MKNCSESTKIYNENFKFYLLPKDKGRHKLWLNAVGWVCIDKDQNIDSKCI